MDLWGEINGHALDTPAADGGLARSLLALPIKVRPVFPDWRSHTLI